MRYQLEGLGSCWWFGGVLMLLVAAGCGPKSDRLQVSGTVSLDGSPLDGGSIRFTSTGEKLASSGAMVKVGEYLIPQEKGLPPGNYQVQITAADEAAAPIIIRTGPGDPGTPTQPERIPAEYNSASKHTVDVTVEGDNHFVFDIVRKQAKK
jgi:hypothetical protein